MERIDLNKLTVADVIITGIDYNEEENKTEIEFNSPIGRGLLTLDFNESTLSEDEEGYEDVMADLVIEAQFDDSEYEAQAFDKLFELVGEAMAIISKDIENTGHSCSCEEGCNCECDCDCK